MSAPASTQTLDLEIGGMTCASCAARTEKRLNRLDGVEAAVNYATEKASVRMPEGYDPQLLIAEVEKTGYTAALPQPAREREDPEAERDPELTALRQRLIGSIWLSVPVIAMAMIPALQFPYWQWLSLTLTAPEIVWAAWPFHRAAWMNLRHGAATMDTLVSVGTGAAFLWSLYALFLGHAGMPGMTHGFELSIHPSDGAGNIYLETAAGVTMFLLAGRYFEKRSKRQAGAALRALLPAEDAVPQKGVSWLPLYHDMGLIGCLLQAVYYPGPLVLIPPELFLAKPALWLRAISRHRATISVAPSFAFALCARKVRDEELSGADLSSWRHALCGAEPVSPDSLDHFARRFEPHGFDRRSLRPVYGLAEASLAVTFTPGGREVRSLRVDPVRLAATGDVVDGTRAIASVGTPVPGTDVEVRDADDRALGERRVGRIFVRGPSVMAGYFDQPAATASVLSGGWLDTGDLGFLAEGELYVCGREKNVIVLRGANHLPQEFEESLAGLESVRAGCAVALGFVPDGEDGEQLLVLAERAGATATDDDDARTADAIRRAILARTGIRPHTVRLLAAGTIPRTSSGKLRRNEALRRFLAGELDPPAKVSRPRILLEVLRSAFAFARARRSPGA